MLVAPCLSFLTIVVLMLFVFFFSSRRRHTRLVSDWSSDVCSSDLVLVGHDVSDRPWFEPGLQRVHVGDVRASSPAMSALLPPAADGAPRRFMDFAAPIRVGDLTQGVLCMHSSWEWVRETMQTLQQADSADRQIGLFIFDRRGRLIHAPGDSLEPLLA